MRGRIVFTTEGTKRYYLNDEEVSKEVFEGKWPKKEPGLPMIAPIQNWADENNGKGREITQLRDSPTSPKVYARNPAHALELAKTKGFDRAERT